MDKTNIESIISVDSFDSVCRLCLRGLEDCKVFNVDDCLFANHEEATEELVIKDILSRCAFIEVSRIIRCFPFTEKSKKKHLIAINFWISP